MSATCLGKARCWVSASPDSAPQASSSMRMTYLGLSAPQLLSAGKSYTAVLRNCNFGFDDEVDDAKHLLDKERVRLQTSKQGLAMPSRTHCSTTCLGNANDALRCPDENWSQASDSEPSLPFGMVTTSGESSLEAAGALRFPRFLEFRGVLITRLM
jgi:hypothetical protein